MNYIDIIILSAVCLCFALGIVSGLIWQIAGIVSLAVGVAATILLGPYVAAAMARWIDSRSFACMFAYVCVFSLASMAVRILAVLFSKLLERIRMKRLDRALGGIVGIVKALLFSAVLVIILGRHGTPGTREAVEASMFGGQVVAMVDFVAGKADEYDLSERTGQALRQGKAAAEDLRQKGLELARETLEQTEEPGEPQGAAGTTHAGPQE